MPTGGFTPTDLIFPLFLFVVGVSISLGPRSGTAMATIWLRALRLVVAGLLLHLVAMWACDLPAFRPWGVLQRIGLCYGVAATLALHTSARAMAAAGCAAAGLLGAACDDGWLRAAA